MPAAPPHTPESLTLELELEASLEPEALRDHAAKKLGRPVGSLPPVQLHKRSLDCRGGRVRWHLLLGIGAPEERATRPLRTVSSPEQVLVVGGGPCGLFCAYELARAGIGCTILERGKEVQPRRRDLKGLTRRGEVDPDSNYCFGEGGAGTYSDGKLYTRSHKRGDVRDVLQVLTEHGAPPDILVDARPHIGSNRLPEVVTSLRKQLIEVGVQFRFGERVTRILLKGEAEPRVVGVELANGERLDCSTLVLATGHSARDVYDMLRSAGHPLEAKPFALGLRMEHPQALINRIQYGAYAEHPKLPSAAYRLVDSRGPLAAFSFCMCPGGFIVPASTQPGELVVNGMSPSRRNSKYANSGIVVGLSPSDWEGLGYTGPLGGVALQQHIERTAFALGGAKLQAPATRLTDFLAGRESSSVPSCSYVPGLTPCNVGELLELPGLSLASSLRLALEQFGRRMRGLITEEAVLVGVESRSSSPVRIVRDATTLQSPWKGLYPAGEGGGYAGGIMSAALDGVRVARQIEAARPSGRSGAGV